MKIAKLILGIVAILTGVLMLWGTLIGAVFIIALGQGVGFIFIGIIAGAIFIANGTLMIKARKGFAPKLELWAIGLIIALFVMALIVHKTYVDLYKEAGILILAEGIVLTLELKANQWKLVA